MFDNMNNDFNNNFNNNMNNGFNNNINNNFDSSNFGSDMNNGFNNNILNNNMNNDFSNSFGNKPLFDNFNNQSSVNYNQEYSGGYNNEDIPPELDEIKPLNNASIYEAPSLDVLGPANFMPENNEPLNASSDPLSLYENGNIDLNSGVNNMNSRFNSSLGNNLGYDNFANNMNNNINDGLGGSYPYNNQGGLGSSYNSLENQPNNMNDNSFNSFENFKNSYQLDNNIPLSSSTNNQFSNLDKNNSHEVSLDENKADSSSSSADFNDYLSGRKDREPNQMDGINNDIVKDKMEVNSSIDNPSFDEKDTVDNNFDHGYEIENDISLGEKSSLDSLDDLGIDDSYNEPDTLEIMDLDEKEDKELKDDADNVDDDLLSSSVDKIKKLIDEIKALGVNIEFEEFDFEQMYQLIIKINKNKED